MKDYIEERALEVAKYILSTNATVRHTAKVFGLSKSTIHKDMSERLCKINPQLANDVKALLEFNKSVRHIRGGLATKQKFNTLDK